MCPYQVRNVLFRPEPEKSASGNSITTINAYLAEKATFWKVHREWNGLSEADTLAKWQSHIAGRSS